MPREGGASSTARKSDITTTVSDDWIVRFRGR